MLTREGLEFTTDLIYNQGDLRVLPLNGTYNPLLADRNEVFSSEISQNYERPAITVDTLLWNPTTLQLDVSLSATYTPDGAATVNRLALLKAGNQYGNLQGTTDSSVQFTIDPGVTHDLIVGDTIVIGGEERTVDTVSGQTITVTGGAISGSPTAIYPSRGTLLGVYQPAAAISITAGTATLLTISGSHLQS
jgi:hypothetical protein